MWWHMPAIQVLGGRGKRFEASCSTRWFWDQTGLSETHYKNHNNELSRWFPGYSMRTHTWILVLM